MICIGVRNPGTMALHGVSVCLGACEGRRVVTLRVTLSDGFSR